MLRILPLALLLPPGAAARADPLAFDTEGGRLALAPFVQVDRLLEQDTPEGFRVEDADVNVARLYVTAERGDLSALFAYEAVGSFVKYASVSYALTDELTVSAGQQDEPFSLTDLTGSRAATYADGPETAALVPGDNLGLSLAWRSERATLSGGVFGGDFRTGIANEGVAVTGRGTFVPAQTDAQLVHLGAGVSVRSGSDLNAGFAEGVGAGILPRAVVSIGDFDDVERISRLSAEAAWRHGSVLLIAEVNGARIEREGAATEDAAAGFASLGWLLTGETRPYGAGTFGEVTPARPVPEGGPGAVELALRLDAADLGEQGRIGRVSVAANWHLTQALRLGLNASVSETEDAALLPGGLAAPEDLRAVFLRLQYAH
jgi:phosphate-selective porin